MEWVECPSCGGGAPLCPKCDGVGMVEGRRFTIHRPSEAEEKRIAWAEREYERKSAEQARKACDEKEQ